MAKQNKERLPKKPSVSKQLIIANETIKALEDKNFKQKELLMQYIQDDRKAMERIAGLLGISNNLHNMYGNTKQTDWPDIYFRLGILVNKSEKLASMIFLEEENKMLVKELERLKIPPYISEPLK